ncbi:MAG TPA: sigma-70 family RNA polymerase sigma factor [Polyangiales bacterium]|nr:sigma-70 family RNA polymerase sigma factor [Polyangiales bacterium]
MQTVVSTSSVSSSIAPPSKAEIEVALIRRFQRGDNRAGDTLMRAQAGLVRSIAHGYRLWGVPLEDLVQQGSIGLLKALQRFDASRTQSLQSYAGYWIRAEIREYVVRSYRIVRLGSTRTERKALRTFRVRSISTPEQLAQESGMPLARCEQLWPLLSRGDTRLDDTRLCTAPLDRITYNTSDPEVLALQAERADRLQRRVADALSLLSARERRIIEARMMSDEPRTLESLAAEFGLSRERVRQLEAAAKAKIKGQLEVEAAA